MLALPSRARKNVLFEPSLINLATPGIPELYQPSHEIHAALRNFAPPFRVGNAACDLKIGSPLRAEAGRTGGADRCCKCAIAAR
jgi:hypothetical protein